MKSKHIYLLIPVFVFSLITLWGCSHYEMRRTLEYYGKQPGFELKVISTDSTKLSSQHSEISTITRYLSGVKKVYILKFDSTKGNSDENDKLYQKLNNLLKDNDFNDVFSFNGKKQVGLYLKKDNSGNIDQTVFLKWGGRYSVYIWAPRSKN
ncbi:MAG: DUF4252 domain-containing protein [Bacteroidales bacterium]|nr:DUF4252 domain-containing protein [Bacteroidales bacterium]